MRLFHSPTRLKFNQIVDNFLQDLKQDEQENSGGNKTMVKNQVQEKAAMIDLKIQNFLLKCFETIGITLSSVGVLGLSGFYIIVITICMY